MSLATRTTGLKNQTTSLLQVGMALDVHVHVLHHQHPEGTQSGLVLETIGLQGHKNLEGKYMWPDSQE